MARWCWIFVFIVTIVTMPMTVSAADCNQDDYHFEYTQCDSNMQRWRVEVPQQGTCTATNFNGHEPTKGTDCNMECEPGNYLDMQTQKCTPCSPGSFSTGSSARFDEWDHLPEGFSQTTESFVNDGVNCSTNVWTPKGSYIAVTPGDCAASLTFSGTLVKAGQLTFKYQYSDTSSIFHITTQNSQCQSATDSNKWPETTSEGKWTTMAVDLKTGLNVVSWKVIGLGVGDQKVQPVMLSQITITGVAYTSECSKCRAGTYSSEKAEYCTACQPNTYSADKGASMCKACDAETQYSNYGATTCETRPVCTDKDYYRLQTPCDENKMTKTIYQWIEPRICQPTLNNSAKLPEDHKPEPCRPCNPGMHVVNGTCQYCPANYRSDGNDCVKCDASTSPDYSYIFENWNSIPDNIRTHCVSFSDKEGCHNDTKWLPFGDHMESHFARGETAYLVIQVSVDGFRTGDNKDAGGSTTVGQFSVTFETNCTGFCQVVLLSNEMNSERQDVINAWEDSNGKLKFVHDVKKNGSIDFTLAFQNTGFYMLSDQYSNSSVRIYSIEVTNTLGGGARECQACPQGSNDDGCIPCKDGYYIDPTTISCVQCPPKTVVYSNRAYGAESCIPCGEGLEAYNGRFCSSDGLFTDDSGHTYDLRNLSASSKFVRGSTLFTSSGTQFYHGFNISLFGDPDKAYVICRDNVTDSSTKAIAMAKAIRQQKTVKAMICRTTMVPSSDDTTTVMTTQSSSLGDHLTKIVHNQTLNDIKNGTESFIRNLYAASGFDETDIENDIQIHYKADKPTRACPDGRVTVVSLRCDTDEKGNGTVVLPPMCADGTCDGCTFHFMWRLRAACPYCQKEDYSSSVLGECKQGKQTIHYFSPVRCNIVNGTKLEEVQPCTLNIGALPLIIQLAIPAIVLVAAFMFFALCFVWRKNKKLEYRYMKLVENAAGGDGELPGVDSCALEEGEDEQQDGVQIRDSKGARFFKKLKNKMTKQYDDEEEFLY